MSKEIPLTQGQVAIVDDEDYEFLNQWTWCAVKHGNTYYARRSIRHGQNGTPTIISMHRAILMRNIHMEIDHKDGNGLNNHKDNLRFCDHAQNQQNRGKHQVKTSRFKGVSWMRRAKKWIAVISVRGHRRHLGYFISETDAAKAYDEAACQYSGKYARPNFD